MSRLPLAQVTLCAVDTRAPAMAMQSLLQSMRHIDFGRVILFTNDWVPRVVLPGIELIDIDPIQSGADYSLFVMRRLPAYIQTSHVLVTQWDGFVVDAAAWSHEFLTYDYVGAPWADQPPECNVGNGGFSLRSRRFLAAGLDPRIGSVHPEDEVLCRTHRALLQDHHGVRFAPAALARRFAFENETPSGPTFGFHGPYHLPRFLPEDELARWMHAMPDDFFLTRDARRLARALLGRGMLATARLVLQRREAAGSTDRKTRIMAAATSLLTRLSSARAG